MSEQSSLINSFAVIEQLKQGMEEIKRPEILALGLSDAIYYSAIQVYMFIWTPILQNLAQARMINAGAIFIVMMISALCQNKALDILHKVFRIDYFAINIAYLLLFGGGFLVIYYSNSFNVSLTILTVINGSFGIYVPLLGYMRAVMLEEKQRALMMNIFKIPFNVIVIVLLVLSGYFEPYFISLLTGGIVGFSILCGIYLYFYYLKHSDTLEISLNIVDSPK